MHMIDANNQKVPFPSIYTAVGALCIDVQFRRDFFHPETNALQQLLPAMEESEYQKCLTLCSSADPVPMEADYSSVGAFFCKRTPCVAATQNIETALGAALLDESFREKWFDHSEQTHLDYGLELTEDENLMVWAILQRRGRELRKAVDALGKTLKQTVHVPALAKPPKAAKAAVGEEAA